MITEALASLAARLLTWVIGAMPVFEVPGWLVAAPDQIGVLTGYASQVSYWVPPNLIVPCLLAVLASVGIGVGLKLGRVILSLVTAGGGSAG